MKKLITGFCAFTLMSSAIAMMEPNDAEVATTMVAINNAEIHLSKLARDKASSQKVRDFADQLVKEHESNREETLALLKRIHLDEKKTDTIYQMQEANRKEYDRLGRLNGKEFDEAYMEAMVRDHKQARYKLDQALVPYAKNQELKASLEKSQKRVEDHLHKARRVEETL